MNPISLMKLVLTEAKIVDLMENKKPMNPTKFTQLIALITQALGSIGVAGTYGPIIAAHTGVSLVLIWIVCIANAIVTIIHAVAPSLTASAVTKVSVLFLAVLLGGSMTLHAQTTTTTTTTSPFTLSTTAMNIQLNGTNSVATDISEALPFVQSKNYGLFTLTEHNIVAPSINLTGYYGGLQWTPDLTKVIAKTLIPANTFQPYIEFGTGVVSNSTKYHSSTFAGGCVNYDPTSEGHFGIPTCVKYLNAPGFGKSPHGWEVSSGIKWSF